MIIFLIDNASYWIFIIGIFKHYKNYKEFNKHEIKYTYVLLFNGNYNIVLTFKKINFVYSY